MRCQAKNPFAYTLDCVDIATGWSEQRAVWGKRETDVFKQIKQISPDYTKRNHSSVISGWAMSKEFMRKWRTL